MEAKIQILDNVTQSFLAELEVENAYIHERINDKYTFDFTCRKQENINYLAQGTIIFIDDDYFRIATITEYPIEAKYEVQCEHISYELNDYDPDEEYEEEDLHYEGLVTHIISEMLEGTRFNFLPSDDIGKRFEFTTRTRGIRSRIIEFCKEFGLEVHWYRFGVAIQLRRGGDHGLTIELGKNLKDLKINKTFNFDGTITTSYDIDFIDLNKVTNENGEPLEEHEFHMGDTVYLKIGNQTIQQRGLAVGYNPFRRELPTIELESPVRSFTEAVAGTPRAALTTVGGGCDEITVHYTIEAEAIFCETENYDWVTDLGEWIETHEVRFTNQINHNLQTYIEQPTDVICGLRIVSTECELAGVEGCIVAKYKNKNDEWVYKLIENSSFKVELSEWYNTISLSFSHVFNDVKNGTTVDFYLLINVYGYSQDVTFSVTSDYTSFYVKGRYLRVGEGDSV